jgi:hypothetical protein
MPPSPPESFIDQCIALAWGAWVELGVSGWGSTHRQWAIDPEPLILFTAWLGDRDARLRDEATDWCIRYADRVSRVRLKSLLKEQPGHVRSAFAELSATVSQHAAVKWPDAMAPRRYRPTGKSRLPPLDRPSLGWLRLRALLGLGARTEVVRYFLSNEHAAAGTAELAAWTGYTKRNIGEACEALADAGELQARMIGNRFSYSLSSRSLLRNFEGVAPIRPNWTAVCTVARTLAELEAESDRRAVARTLPMKVKKALTTMHDDLAEVGAQPPPADTQGPALWPAVVELDRRTLRRWAAGHWTDSR